MIAVFEQLLPASRRRVETALQMPRRKTVWRVRVQMPTPVSVETVRRRMPTSLAMRVSLLEEPRPDGWTDVVCVHRDAAELVFASVRRGWPGSRVVLVSEEQPCDQ